MRTKLPRSPLLFTAVSSLLAVACAPAESPLTLHEFDCGVIRFESVAMFGIGDDETDVRDEDGDEAHEFMDLDDVSERLRARVSPPAPRMSHAAAPRRPTTTAS